MYTQACESALKRLDTNYIDLFTLRGPIQPDTDIVEVAKELKVNGGCVCSVLHDPALQVTSACRTLVWQCLYVAQSVRVYMFLCNVCGMQRYLCCILATCLMRSAPVTAHTLLIELT